MKKRSFLWITGPWESLYPLAGETTLRLAEEALNQGHECHWADGRSIRLEGGHTLVDARKMRSIGPARGEADFDLAPVRPTRVSAFTQVHYRTDPPIDLAYIHPLQLLCRERSVEIVNPPDVIFGVSEKFAPQELTALMPPTIVSAQREHLLAFLKKENKAVLKPLHQAQSKGIERVDADMQNAQELDAAFARATENFTRPALLQRYLPAIAQGETRLWYVDGTLLATVTKLPLKGDFRVDIDRGSGLAPVRLDAREKKASTAIGKYLRKVGVRLAAIDLIEGRITDFNITSPGLIPQMETLLGVDLAKPLIRKLARRS